MVLVSVRKLPRPQLVENLRDARGFFRRQEQIPEQPALDFLEAITGEALAGLVEQHNPALDVQHDDECVRGIYDSFKKAACYHDMNAGSGVRDDSRILEVVSKTKTLAADKRR